VEATGRALAAALGDLIPRLLSALGETAAAPAVGEPAGVTPDIAALRAALEKLREALARFDLEESSTALKEIAAMAAPPDVSEPIARLRQLVDGYEYEEAAAMVAELLGRLGGGNPS
jgi:hypothetical protein